MSSPAIDSTAQSGNTSQDTKFLVPGYSIHKKSPPCSEGTLNGVSACYYHSCMGSLLISNQTKKVHILTVAHLFGDQPDEFFLMKDRQPLVPFQYPHSEINIVRERDCALIPIGTLDSQNNQILFQGHGSEQGQKLHFHFTNPRV